MGWFGKNMPTVAKLFSLVGGNRKPNSRPGKRRGNPTGRPNRQEAAARVGRSGGDESGAGHGPIASRQTASPSGRSPEDRAEMPPESEPVVAFTIPASDGSGQLLAAHELNASFEAALRRAQVAASQYLEARDLRERSRSEFAQGQNVWTEAIGAGESAGRNYAARTESIRSRYEAGSAAFSSALANAQGLSEESHRGLQAALDSLNAAIARVAKELEGAAAASSIAGSLLSSAMEELRAVEALNPGAPSELPFSDSDSGRAQPGAPAARAARQLEEPYVLRQELTTEAASTFIGETADLPGESSKPRVVRKASGASQEGDGAPTESGEADTAATEPARMTFIPDEIANAPPATDFPGTPGATAAEELQRELQALRPLLADAGPAPGETPEQSAAGREDRANPDEPEALIPPDAVRVSGTPVGPAPEIARNAIPPNFGGVLFLMFDAAAAQEHLEEIWDAVEDASSVGAIVDNRLISRSEGVQFTLDLRKAHLDVGAFRMGLPGAEIEQVDDNRLRVKWSP